MSITAYTAALAAGQDMDSYEPPRNRFSAEYPYELYIKSTDPRVAAHLYQNSFATEADGLHELERLTSAGGDRIVAELEPGKKWLLQYRGWESQQMIASLDYGRF